jgi:hypothetical protein
MDGSTQLQVLILNQRRAIVWYLGFAGGVALLGLTMLVFGVAGILTLAGEPQKVLFGIGGPLVSSISGVPIKDVLRCKDRIAVYRDLRAQLTAASNEDRERIEAIVWDAVKSIAVGS